MFKMFKNTAYYFKELQTLVKMKPLSTLFSIMSLTLIFFLVLLTTYGWWWSYNWIERIRSEAEVAVYYEENLNAFAVEQLRDNLEALEGVSAVTLVPQEESLVQMQKILGEESEILDLFDENPFQAYFSLTIDVEQRFIIVDQIKVMKDIAYFRDNQEILSKMSQWINIVQALSWIVITTVVFTTWIITSHIIREGIQSNKTHIETLQLLGAPKLFIWIPYVMQGTLSTLLAGLFAIVLIATLLSNIDLEIVFQLQTFVLFIMLASLLGFVSSFFSIRSVQLKPQ